MKKIYSLLVLLCSATMVWGQTTIFSENFGAPSATTAITAYTGWQNNGTLTFTDGGATAAADVRNTSVSSTYAGASGGGNIFFTSTAGDRGFAIEGINASAYNTLTLQFGYRKESATALPMLALDFWNGTAWVNLPLTFNEAASAAIGWYLSPVINLPAAAQINGLKLRWVKSGNNSTRLDDVILKGIAGAAATLGATSVNDFGNVNVGTPSVSQSFNVSGANLTGAPGNITIGSPSADFQVSNDNTSWGSSTTVAYTSATLANTAVYVRFNPQSAGAKTANLSLSGGGATSITVPVSGTGFVAAPAAPVATAATAVGGTGFTANWNAVAGATGYRLDVYKLTGGSSVSTLAGWNFGVNTAASQTADAGNANNIGIKTVTSNGLNVISWPAGPSGASGTPNPFSVSANGWDNGQDTKYWAIDVNTTGASNITLSSLQGSSGTGPSSFKVQYRIGAGPWTDVPGGTVTLTTAVVPGTLSTWGAINDLPLPGTENQASVGIRWIMASNTSINGTAVASGGTSRISAIYIKGMVSSQVASYIAGYQDLAVGNTTSQAVTGLDPNTTYYYVVRAENAGGASSNSNEISVTTPAVVLPAITVSNLTGFGSTCLNTTSTPASFTITGVNLTNADVTVGPLAGYSFSTTANGTYTPSLTLTQPGGAFSQQIFVQFTPTAVQSYDGNIAVAGGGAAAVNVAATGAGINTAPSVTTGSATVTTTSATASGSISSNGCSAISAYGIEFSTTSGFANGTGTQVPATNLAAGNFSSLLSILQPGTTYYYKAYATNAGGTSYGTEQSFVTTSLLPSISTTMATGFGNVCINTTSSATSQFTITGTNLTNADITVGPLAGFEFATTAGGTYSSTLTLTQTGGAFSQDIFVRFKPTAAQSYDGNIPVNGGGIASAINVAITGAGVNTAPSVTTGASSAVTHNSATLSASIPAGGCTAITAYGIEYSTTNGFAGGTGTQVAATNLSGTNFSVNLNTGLAASTTYYYRAYATNAGGVTYGAQQSFTTLAPPPPSLTATTLAAFGSSCAGTEQGPNSFTITGTNLTNANISVGPLPGYSFSTTANGTYSNNLILTQSGGSFTQTIYVKFTPTVSGAQNGNIAISGGGAAAINVAASGTGLSTPPTVTTGASSNITVSTVTLGGSVGSAGCTNTSDYGIEYSTVNGFAFSTGVQASAGTVIANAPYSVNLSGLIPGVTYYYRAYAKNAGGTSYGAQQSFTLATVPASFMVYPSPVNRGKQLHITMNGLRAGYYGIVIHNSYGQKVYQRNINTQSSFINESFALPTVITPGVYRVSIVNSNDVLETRTIVVFN